MSDTRGSIDIDRDARRWRVVINRPQKANALTHTMLGALLDALAAAAADPSLRLLTLTGAGQRVFCAGADLGEAAAKDDPRDPVWDEITARLEALPALTIAAINGHCIGGGLVLALCCDLRIAVPDADFAYPALRMGALPGRVDGQRLNALVGPGRAALLLLADARIDAGLALDWGLVERVVEPHELEASVAAAGSSALPASREQLVAMKQAIWSPPA